MRIKVITSIAHRWVFSFLTAICVLLSKSSPAQAESLRYLATGEQALMQMAELIQSAQSSIDFTYYILDPCSASAKVLFNLLKEKAARGVKVRIIVDAFTHNKDLQQNLRESLLKSGIELRYFNKVGVTPNINHRTHAKVMIADGQRYITGGRNIADDYFNLAENNFIDRDVYVEGASAKQAQQRFNDLWENERTYSPKASADTSLAKFEATCLKEDKKSKGLSEALRSEAHDALSRVQIAQCSDVTFTMDDPSFWLNYTPISSPYGDSPNPFDEQAARLVNKDTTQEILKFLKEPTDNLVLENWSYIPALPIDWILKDLRRNNIPIMVVTNRTTDVGGSVDVLNKHYSKRDNHGSQTIIGLSNLGSMRSSWSQTPESAKWMIHSKVFVANNNRVAVTSFNLDPRSFHTNIETGLFVRNCPDFAKQVLAETSKLIKTHIKDADCEVCQKTPDTPVLDTVKAWLSHELL